MLNFIGRVLNPSVFFIERITSMSNSVNMAITHIHLVWLFGSHVVLLIENCSEKRKAEKPILLNGISDCVLRDMGFIWAPWIPTFFGIHFYIKESPETPTVLLLTISVKLIYSINWIVDIPSAELETEIVLNDFPTHVYNMGRISALSLALKNFDQVSKKILSLSNIQIVIHVL